MSNEVGRESDLNFWMNLLTRFTKKPLHKDLIANIDRHFSY